jgi:hypothetical protein
LAIGAAGFDFSWLPELVGGAEPLLYVCAVPMRAFAS